VGADQLTFNANKGAFPRKSVNEVLGRLWRGARTTFQALLDMKFLDRRRPQVFQVLVTDRAFRKVAQLRAGLLPPRGRRNGQPLLSDNDALQRIRSLHIRRDGDIQFLEARHADSVRCRSVCCRNGNSRVMHDIRGVQQRPLGGTPITKYSAAPPAVLSGVNKRPGNGIFCQSTYMLTDSNQQVPQIRKEHNSLFDLKS
jgi:hypothetical protein